MADFEFERLRRPQPFREGMDMVRWAEEVHQACEEYASTLDTIRRKLETGWTDLRAPATAINPTGPASPPAFNATDMAYTFDNSGNETLFITMQMPHEWLVESNINPHVHWLQKAQDLPVHWYVNYRIANNGTEFPTTFTRYNMYNRVFDNGSTGANFSQVSVGAGIDMTGFRDSCILQFQLIRDSTDSYAGDASMLEFDVHYQREDFGSPEQFGD